MYSYVAKQPIFNRDLNTVAFELLYRDSESNCFPQIDPNLATTQVMMEQFLIHQGRLLDGQLAFVNFSQECLIKGIPLDFPKDKYVVEVLETCEPNEALYRAIELLKNRGYTIALDDFIHDHHWKPFLKLVDIIKFDIQQTPIPLAARLMDEYKEFDLTYLAEKVETNEQFSLAKESGFDYFQGYFFALPDLSKNRTLPADLGTSIELCQAVAKEQLDIEEVYSIISKSSALSFKLLNFVNLSGCLSKKISSLRQALIYLGEDKIRKFTSYIAILSAAIDKPNQLIIMSLQRAKFLELLTEQSHYGDLRSKAYLCGLLSYLDALLDTPIADIILPLNLDHEIKHALIHRDSYLGEMLRLTNAIERFDWNEVEIVSKTLKVPLASIISCYNQTCTWSNDLLVN